MTVGAAKIWIPRKWAKWNGNVSRLAGCCHGLALMPPPHFSAQQATSNRHPPLGALRRSQHQLGKWWVVAREQPEAGVLALFQSASAWSRKRQRAVNANASSEQYGRELLEAALAVRSGDKRAHGGCQVLGRVPHWSWGSDFWGVGTSL